MQFLPDSADLLAAVGRLLGDDVLGTVPPHLQHPVRVAAHLVQLVEREVRLGPEHAARERAWLAELLGADVENAQAVLAARIRAGDDPELERRSWTTLVAITRQDLAVAKPGHDSWEGE